MVTNTSDALRNTATPSFNWRDGSQLQARLESQWWDHWEQSSGWWTWFGACVTRKLTTGPEVGVLGWNGVGGGLISCPIIVVCRCKWSLSLPGVSASKCSSNPFKGKQVFSSSPFYCLKSLALGKSEWITWQNLGLADVSLYLVPKGILVPSLEPQFATGLCFLPRPRDVGSRPEAASDQSWFGFLTQSAGMWLVPVSCYQEFSQYLGLIYLGKQCCDSFYQCLRDLAWCTVLREDSGAPIWGKSPKHKAFLWWQTFNKASHLIWNALYVLISPWEKLIQSSICASCVPRSRQSILCPRSLAQS